MMLLYYDQYLDQLITMPKFVQKKAMEFIKKFKQNSKSSAIHLEPISTFKDQRLRSARIDQSYRVIIRVPESGDVYYVLWIDHHDKAYKWAENKTADWNEETQTVQIFSADINPLIENKNDSNEAVNLGPFSEYKEKDLLKLGVPKVLLSSIQNIRDQKDLESLIGFIPDELVENLYFLLEGTAISILITEIEEGKSSGTSIDDKANSINNQRFFIQLDEDDEVFDSILKEDFTKWKFYLHPSQRKIVEYNSKGPLKISGGAGTGKTVAAIHRLKYLSELPDSKKTVFLTYTNALTKNLNETLKGFKIRDNKFDISTIDSFVHKKAMEYGIISAKTRITNRSGVKSEQELWDELYDLNVYEYDLSLVMREYTDVILYNDIKEVSSYYRISRIGMGKAISRRQRNEIWKIMEAYESHLNEQNYIHELSLYNKVADHLKKNGSEEYGHCIVDELQDLSNVHLRFIRALIPEGPNDLFLVGDPLQNIYDRKLNFSKVGIHIRGKRSRRLRINYRTTEEIRQRAIAVIKGIDFENFDGEVEPTSEYISLFHGSVPNMSVYSSTDQEYQAIMELIDKYINSDDPKYSSICIATRVKHDLKGIKSVLHSKSIPYYDVKDRAGEREGIQLCTFHSLKGLEYKHVILAGVNDRTCPYHPYGFESWTPKDQAQHLDKERSLIYVAMTRARESVDILGVGQKTQII